MRHKTRWIGVGLLGLASVGCVTADFPGQPGPGDLGRDLTPANARMQRADDAPIMLAQAPPLPNIPTPPPGVSAIPVSSSKGANPLPPPLPSASSLIAPPPPPTSGGNSGTQQTSLTSARSARASVRAWVNGRPIFEDEIILELQMNNAAALNEASADKITQVYNQTLNRIIELEIAYQDAVKKLEKGNPRALEKLREMVDQEYQKQSKQIRKSVPDEKFAEIAPTFRRQLERQFIGMEYIRSRIFPAISSIGHQELKDYYDTHLNEFQKIESVKWQHVFIAVNAQRPTVTDARRHAEALLDQVNRGADFTTLAKYDDGDSKTRGSAGFGTRKGEIQPAEVEQYLFKMQAGQVGPIVDVSTGVHLFRLVTREEGGQILLNEAVQNKIRTKLRNEIFDREFKRFVRELKTRAVVEVERGT